ncbi:hypothetical protein EVAR_47019_1 [Eumeta japonica]|uniref:Uncharacterized protein n=1 Tax=Eumeta variegata TaxID=151549 RepID=A0A4C1XHX6_EUMVA|nr:hypothetical protein EVAR_47019_1 [Eumeta japonica]
MRGRAAAGSHRPDLGDYAFRPLFCGLALGFFISPSSPNRALGKSRNGPKADPCVPHENHGARQSRAFGIKPMISVTQRPFQETECPDRNSIQKFSNNDAVSRVAFQSSSRSRLRASAQTYKNAPPSDADRRP